MLLLGSAFLWLMFAGSDWFALEANGHEVPSQIPVWKVGHVITRFFQYVNGNDTQEKKKEQFMPQEPPPYYYYPPYMWPKPPKTTTTTTAPTTNPTEPTRISPLEPSLCEIYPSLSICQEIQSVSLEDSDNRIPTVLSESQEFGSDHQLQLQELQKLTITSEAHLVSSLCFYYARLCRNPEKAQFVRLTDRHGKPMLLIYPATGEEYPLDLRKTFRVRSRRTRRPSW